MGSEMCIRDSARAVSLMYGGIAMLAFGFLGKPIFKLWLRRPIQLDSAVCWLAGLYVLLAAWEYIHWPLSLGLGAMRSASNLVLARAVIFAALMPWAVRYGPVGVIGLLCASVVLISSWTYPILLSGALTRFRSSASLMGRTAALELGPASRRARIGAAP